MVSFMSVAEAVLPGGRRMTISTCAGAWVMKLVPVGMPPSTTTSSASVCELGAFHIVVRPPTFTPMLILRR